MAAEEKTRSSIAHYVNSTPSETADTWELLGFGISSAQMTMSPQTDTVQYVHQDTATSSVTGYQPQLPVNQIVSPGDDLFDFIDGIRQAGPSIGSDDLTELVEVRLYEDPATDEVTYPASKWSVQVQIDDAPGGDGGSNAEIAYTLLIQGDLTDGDFDTSGLSFSSS